MNMLLWVGWNGFTGQISPVGLILEMPAISEGFIKTVA